MNVPYIVLVASVVGGPWTLNISSEAEEEYYAVDFGDEAVLPRQAAVRVVHLAQFAFEVSKW